MVHPGPIFLPFSQAAAELGSPAPHKPPLPSSPAASHLRVLEAQLGRQLLPVRFADVLLLLEHLLQGLALHVGEDGAAQHPPAGFATGGQRPGEGPGDGDHGGGSCGGGHTALSRAGPAPTAPLPLGGHPSTWGREKEI